MLGHPSTASSARAAVVCNGMWRGRKGVRASCGLSASTCAQSAPNPAVSAHQRHAGGNPKRTRQDGSCNLLG